MNKHQAMWEYIQQYEELESFLHFNSMVEFVNGIGFEPIYSQEEIKQYSNGDKLCKYDFAIVKMLSFVCEGTSTINVDSIYDVQLFMEWINNQNKMKNFPDFGDKCIVQCIENLQNMPNLAGVTEDGVAKYMLQCSVTYLEEMER